MDSNAQKRIYKAVNATRRLIMHMHDKDHPEIASVTSRSFIFSWPLALTRRARKLNDNKKPNDNKA
jgi:hypothetical protein